MPTLEDLVWFFESEPVHPFGVEDAPWSCVCLRFALTRGSLRVELEVEPAPEVRSLVVEERAGRELLGLVFDEQSPVDGSWLQTKSSLSLTRRTGVDE